MTENFDVLGVTGPACMLVNGLEFSLPPIALVLLPGLQQQWVVVQVKHVSPCLCTYMLRISLLTFVDTPRHVQRCAADQEITGRV